MIRRGWGAVAVLAGLLAPAGRAGAQAPSPSPQPAPTPLGKPCEAAPESRALDFWIGDWDVRPNGGLQPGRKPSKSHIERVEDGCVIAEFYTTAVGYSGRSINAYDATTKKWQQVWMDNQGGVHNYFGEARDGNLYYQAEGIAVQGQTKLAKVKMTFFNQDKDHVRQLGEQSLDEGKTWTTSYDLIYTRRAP